MPFLKNSCEEGMTESCQPNGQYKVSSNIFDQDKLCGEIGNEKGNLALQIL
jgi:hypothetical protein